MPPPPRGYMSLYADFFREGNFHLPISKFIGEVLTGYGLHISQISALGLPRVTYFEFICRANRVEPSFEKFNVFYFVTYTGGFYSFSSRTTGVDPCSWDPPKSLHDWKQKFFYIHRGVIPLDMHYRAECEGVPRVNVSVDFPEQEWYKVLTRKVTHIIQIEERALVAAGMSMLWATQNPRGFSIYKYQGKGIFDNVFDSKAGGAMVVAALPEGRPLCVDQIRNNFLHPTSESMTTYANTVLGEDDGDDIDVDSVPTREEVIVLSSEGSDGSHEDLIHRSTRAGPQQGTVCEPIAADVETLAEDPQGDTVEQLETWKKRRRDKTEGKKAEELVTEAPRTGDKCAERDPDDDATLTEIVKKKKALEDKKKELDALAAAALAEKKFKLQKDTAIAPSESEIDLGVFSEKVGNLLEKMYKSDAGSRAPKSSKSQKGKGTGDDVEVHQVREDVTVGAGGDEGHADGVETEVESSETTPHATIYPKLVPGSRGGGVRGPPEPRIYACSRLRECFRKKHHRMDLLDDHIHAGVNLYATCQEIVREWQLMGEDTLEFEAAKKELAEGREKFNAEKKGLLWRVSVAEDKLAKEKQFNANKQKEWETTCERTNREMQNARDQIVKLKGEKTQISNEQEQERALYQKRENEYIQRIAKLEKIASEKVAESKASEILAEETAPDCKWLLARVVPLGRAAAASNEKDYHFKLHKEDCTAAYTAKRREYEFIEFGIVKAVEKLSRNANAIEVLKKALGDQDPEGGDAGPSHKD
ncbi:hypothetical protein Hanom_Chr06g00500011 [Helianthus anomalus]